MRLIFAGTPAAAVPSLDALATSRHAVQRVVTRPPAPQGRSRRLAASPVDERAAMLGLPVLRASRLGAAETAELAALDADLGVVVAYGALLREPLLSAPRLGWVNLHFSLLPRWRGAAPVQHALLAGDREVGVSVFQLEAGLDTGPLWAREPVAVGALETAGHLLERLARHGARVLADVVDRLEGGGGSPVPQDGVVTLAPKLTAADGLVDWTQPAARVLDRVRGATPEPGAAALQDGARLKLLEVAPARGSAPLPAGEVALVRSRVLAGTGDEPVELVTVQPAGRRAMPAADWLRGARGAVRLG